MHRPSTMDPGSRPLGEPLSAATSQFLSPGGARAMGAPHSPLDPPKRLSHQPSPVGGGACAAAGNPVPKACSDLYLSEPWPPQVQAGLGVCSATDLLQEVCRSLCRWRDPRGRRISRLRSPLGSFPHGVGAAAGLHSAPSPGAQSTARRTPPQEVCRSLWNRNLPRSNIPWRLGAEFTVGWSPLAVL